MDQEDLFDSSWNLYNMELTAGSLGPMLMGEMIAEFLDRGYYLLKLERLGDLIDARFDRGPKERIWIELKMHKMDLGTLASFGGICHILIYKGIEKRMTSVLSGQIKEMLSTVSGPPEPGVFMVIQDGASYFLGTAVYLNIRDHLDMGTLRIRPDGIMRILDEVMEEIVRVDGSLEVDI